MLYVDVPGLTDIRAIASERQPGSVSIYLPTTPLTQDITAARIAYENLVRTGLEQVVGAGLDKKASNAISEHLMHLLDDETFWAHQAHSLAVLASPAGVRTFRLANALPATVQVSDRFHVMPLMRAVTFPNHALILVLTEEAPRFVEVTADMPAQELSVPGLPKSAADSVNKSTINSRSASGRIHGSEGQKVRLTQYARSVDAAIRPILVGRDEPLILASSEPLRSIYRSVTSATALLAEGIDVGPTNLTAAQLAERARPILDRSYESEVAAFAQLYSDRASTGRASSDMAQVARAAVAGAVQTLYIDFEDTQPGLVDEAGVITRANTEGAETYSLLGEIATTALLNGATVKAVRKADLPQGGSLAAVLRYAF
jgi:hypothetical protein